MRTGVSALRLSTADGIENMYLAALQPRFEAVDTLYVVAAGKDIDVLADIAGLGQDAVAKRRVPPPQFIENAADRREFPGQGDLDLAAGERFQISAEMNGYRHIVSLPDFASYAPLREIISRKDAKTQRKTKLQNTP
jgi:hypothetical protein